MRPDYYALLLRDAWCPSRSATRVGPFIFYLVVGIPTVSDISLECSTTNSVLISSYTVVYITYCRSSIYISYTTRTQRTARPPPPPAASDVDACSRAVDGSARPHADASQRGRAAEGECEGDEGDELGYRHPRARVAIDVENKRAFATGAVVLVKERARRAAYDNRRAQTTVCMRKAPGDVRLLLVSRRADAALRLHRGACPRLERVERQRDAAPRLCKCGRRKRGKRALDIERRTDVEDPAQLVISSKILGGASQIVSMIRVKCNGK